MSFNCTSCGQCCRKIGKILTTPAPYPFMERALREFPHKAREDGVCEMLGEDNRCTVYDDRPLLCNIEQMANEPSLPMTKLKWYQMNYQGCNTLQLEIR
jgi:Fe-S-cluster containining protein